MTKERYVEATFELRIPLETPIEASEEEKWEEAWALLGRLPPHIQALPWILSLEDIEEDLGSDEN